MVMEQYLGIEEATVHIPKLALSNLLPQHEVLRGYGPVLPHSNHLILLQL